MTAATITRKTAASRSEKPTTAVPLTTLTVVELRKMTNTRAGQWLLLGIGAVTAVVLGIAVGTGDADTRSFSNLTALAQLPLGVLLPVLGILAATSEWSQRTVLTTFALVPSRGRVLAAKVLSAAALALGAFVFSVVIAAVFAAIAPVAGTTNADWTLGLADLGQLVVFQQLNMMMGVAFGTLLLSSPLAIVLYFVLPTIWGAVASAFAFLSDASAWLNTEETWMPLVETNANMGGNAWPQVFATAALWIALPLGVGLVRLLRKEVD